MPIVRAHDQFYTQADTARFCVDSLFALFPSLAQSAVFVEPSAGAGAFLELLPRGRRLGVDVAPAHPEVVSADFLQYEVPPEYAGRPLVVIGNPPFGRNSSLAVKFVNHAAALADIVAFILPKTFQKASTIRRLDTNLHLVAEYELPDFSFIFEGKPWDVPCVFQVWERRESVRMDEDCLLTHVDFQFVSRVEANFAIRRVGRSAGLVLREFSSYSRTSHHFVRAADPENVIRILSSIDWSTVRQRTAGIPCVGKEEIIRLYSQAQAKEKHLD